MMKSSYSFGGWVRVSSLFHLGRLEFSRLIMACCMSLFIAGTAFSQSERLSDSLHINSEGYFEMQGLNVMAYSDFYPEGHQGGITIVQFGERDAANGDVRIDPTPGQWSPVPKMGPRVVDRKDGIIKVTLWYPDSSQDGKGFNPLVYPKLNFKYTVETKAVGSGVEVTVNLDRPLPEKWSNRVGFNMELFPGSYFGKYYLMDGKSGVFPRQEDSPLYRNSQGNLEVKPMAVGKDLIVSPGDPKTEINFVSMKGNLELIDGRGLYNNGWFVIRSTIPSGETKNVVEWMISPKTDTSWRYTPVVQVSQVGYAPSQGKFAVIELDKLTESYHPIQLVRVTPDSEMVVKTDSHPVPWGDFLRYKYLKFDFTDVTAPGIYKVRYGKEESNEFQIAANVYAHNVWQPTLEFFLAEQMCHMKVEGRYRVWHGLCHMDDATMAPINKDHFDGYFEGPSTLCKWKSGQHVPGLNIGGWHDAGDYDLRVESQAGTVYKLGLMYELFHNNIDQTSINETTRLTQIHVPDGKPDILEQMEHGLLQIVAGYTECGIHFRGIQEATLHQYTLLGDGMNATDNLVYRPGATDPILHRPLKPDDRMVFTQTDPRRELYVAAALAESYRVMKNFDRPLAEKSLALAEKVFREDAYAPAPVKINAAAELYLTTGKKEYEDFLIANVDTICENVLPYSIELGRITFKINNSEFTAKVQRAVEATVAKVNQMMKQNPYGVPYKPYIWGAGWQIQEFGVDMLFLHLGFPKLVTDNYAWNALDFVLGCHPGSNTASFVSGVGVNSMTVAYGANRADWSYIPGGVASGTALIRPDLPELKVWPYFWQQGEYVMGGGATNFMLLAMAADNLLNK